MVAFGPPLSKLALIANGKVKQNGSNEWIGDQDGFEAFQEFRQKRLDPSIPFIVPMLGTGRESEAKQPTFDMIGTMRQVIGQESVAYQSLDTQSRLAMLMGLLNTEAIQSLSRKEIHFQFLPG
jgi:hypothetical protein